MIRKNKKLHIIPLFVLICHGVINIAPVPAHASADAKFFRMNDQFNDRFGFGGDRVILGEKATGLVPAQPGYTQVQGPASRYFRGENLIYEPDNPPILPPPPFDVDTRTLRASGEILELELDQVVTVNGRDMKRFAATTQGKIEFYLESPDALQLKATGIGRTFVHIWDSEGRLTFPIKIIPQQQIIQVAERARQKIEESKSFRVEYNESRSVYYTGNSFESLNQNSLSYLQSFKVAGDTPYGFFTGQAQIRKSDPRALLSSIQLKLEDIHVGELKPMDVTVGDYRVTENMFILPVGRFRGVKLDYANKNDKHQFTSFFGRELNSVSGTISSASESVDSWVYGLFYNYRPDQKQVFTFGYLEGYGQERADELNRRGVGIKHSIQLNEYAKVESEVGFDNERFAWKVQGALQNDTMNLVVKFQEASKYFRSLIGSGGGQGRQELVTHFGWTLNEDMSISYRAEVFRDSLSFREGSRDRYNVRQNGNFNWSLGGGRSLTVKVADNDETALQSPTRADSIKVTYKQPFHVLNRKVSTSVTLGHEESESLTNPDLFYRRNTVNLSATTNLPRDFKFSYSHNIAQVEEMNLRSVAHPRSSVYALSRQTRITDTPILVDFDFRYVDQEETESNRSFLSGEDSVELSSSIRYAIKDMELYVDGRYSLYRADNTASNEARAEAEVVTGLRYAFDTGFTWETQAAFHGYVFQDFNSDGKKQEDEPGIENMKLLISDKEVLTDHEGRFETPTIKGKGVSITLDANSIPYGYASTSALRKNVLVANASLPVEFGLVAKSSIEGVVYNDLNANGHYDRGEPGVAGIVIKIDGADKAIETNGKGSYRFSDVVIGEHDLVLDVNTLALGYLPSGQLKKTILLSKGVRYRTDFGVKSERVVSGRVYIDVNKNNQIDENEMGFAGAKVLFGDMSIITDDEGYYLFNNIHFGTHTLTVHPNTIMDYTCDFAKDIKISNDPIQRVLNIPLNITE